MENAPNTTGGGHAQFASDDLRQKLSDKMTEIHLKDHELELQRKAATIGLPYMNLQGFPINTDSIGTIPEEVARELLILCFWSAIDDLRVGAVNPDDPRVVDYVATLGKEHFTTAKLHLISEKSFETGIKAYLSVPKIMKARAGVAITEADLSKVSAEVRNLQEIGPALNGVTTTEAVTVAVAGALKTRATDIHIEAEEKAIVLRYRIDGVLYAVATLPKSMWAKMVPRIKLLSGLKINVLDRPQDGRFTIHLTNDQVDVRVSTLPTAYGESIVMRVLKSSSTGVSFEDLGMVGHTRARLEEALQKPQGMIVTTGPTGSGKTTTLYAILRKLNNAKTKIVTLEDPIEYHLDGINQSQVDPAAGYTFAAGLRSILRQDPNVVMVGEIRDLETADIAANAALTGHLVFSTLHTNSAAGAIPRFLGMGLKPFLLPPALSAIIGQRLVRRICTSCRIPDKLEPEVLKRVEAILKTVPDIAKSEVPEKLVFQKGAGCDACQGLGFKGQISIYEIFAMSKEIEAAVLSDAVSERNIEAIAEKQGMVTMVQDGLIKALQGITAVSEVFRVSSEESE